MAHGFGDWPGGILGLLELLSEHEGAVRYDLLVAGLNLDDLGSKRLSWLDLMVFVVHSPRGSALYRASHPEFADWGVVEHLLASTVDALNAANWQRAGKKTNPKPKPVQRPGLKKDKKFGSNAIPISEFKAWWDNN